jgi:hypothetical protein
LRRYTADSRKQLGEILKMDDAAVSANGNHSVFAKKDMQEVDCIAHKMEQKDTRHFDKAPCSRFFRVEILESNRLAVGEWTHAFR